MNSGDNYLAELEDDGLVGHAVGEGFDPALLQNMRRCVIEGKPDNVHAIIVSRGGVLVTPVYRRMWTLTPPKEQQGRTSCNTSC